MSYSLLRGTTCLIEKDRYKNKTLNYATQVDNGFLQVDYTLKTKYNYDLTNKFTLNRSTGCLRLKEVKTKE